MNIFGKETIIDTRAGRILLKSEIIKEKEYEWLKILLEESNDYTVKMSQLANLEDKHQTFLTSSLYKNLYKNASDEWKIDHLDDTEEKLECSLCGQKDTKKKFYIKNKINNTMLNVGSTCINNFMDIRDINGKTVAEVNKEWERQQRIKVLNDKYPGIIEKIDNWNKKIEEIPTIINGNSEYELDRLYNQIQELYNKFIKKKKADLAIANKINELVYKGENLLQEIYKDIDKKKNNDWYITKEIKDWCLNDRERNKIVIEFLKQDGVITWRSSCRIQENNFVKMVLEKLKECFNNSNIQIMEFNESNKSLIINIRDGNIYTARIDLECLYSNFMSEFGEIIFKENKKYIDAKKFILENSRIISENSIDISISNMKFLLDKSQRRIYKWDTQYNEIVFYGDNKKYIIVNAKQFINKFIELVFCRKLQEKEIEDINKYVMKNGEVIESEEYISRIETREKAEKAMQVDYSKFV